MTQEEYCFVRRWLSDWQLTSSCTVGLKSTPFFICWFVYGHKRFLHLPVFTDLQRQDWQQRHDLVRAFLLRDAWGSNINHQLWHRDHFVLQLRARRNSFVSWTLYGQKGFHFRRHERTLADEDRGSVSPWISQCLFFYFLIYLFLYPSHVLLFFPFYLHWRAKGWKQILAMKWGQLHVTACSVLLCVNYFKDPTTEFFVFQQ